MSEVLLLSRDDVERVLSIDDCIAAVEDAFRDGSRPASLSVHVDGGAFHVKAAALRYFAAKVNGNFFANPSRGLPRIQGVIVLCDSGNGRPLAILDSIYITILRTGAATAVAAKYLARRDASTLLVCGCGNQGRVSVDAIRRVRPIRRVLLFDADRAKAEALAREVGGEVANEIGVDADICVTCTPSRTPFFGRELLRPGLFVAAVGADSNEKQEIDGRAMAAARVVVDDLDQCASFGDLRAAIHEGLMTRDDVAATIAEVITGVKQGRRSDDESIIFDSTGTALQDVAAAAIAYERAKERGIGARWNV